ncbi:hypothetical protein CNAG_06703 [Cryptococcus neoformans var. grubii H99]|uniref:Uncharacterized protein n=1 Tax=Cryptococcus neoformans (strain H99 / ATCC 208821 / CBS 10515 / FGSC 9487) TaxID=235443 RepID=J9VI72_CRYN9|nr:hypothetical protein CNAG_06703 [Cryptococcus neoformans var. grubii H99]AFR93096.1 hypothetical protein CNAG_06703 [Cryptococcus neoformans var. grubii H99]AUB22593.1 hypothetical protein CKF44_06703 [Cryptococcus neoformans var. grubii]|eukprot:XP_012047680.1 hypothetical protein CNAG_06703 [Cryptococcus neoformans var. grubii H99]
MSFTPGHPANATYPSPLCYVPFDINQLYSVPNVVAINSLSEIRKRNMLEQLGMAARYRTIADESDASTNYLFYFYSFIGSSGIPPYFQYDNYDMSRQEFMGRQWSDIDVVKEFKRPETAKSAKDGRASSISFDRSISKIKSITETSTEKGATTPDFVFRVRRGGVVEKVCGVGELKWRTESEREQQRNSFYYDCKEGIFQSVWYVVAAFDLFKCRLGFTIVDWSFCRLAMMMDEAGRNVVVLEANDKAVKKFHSQYGDALSANDLDNLEEVWSDMPNTLFTEDWEIDQEARDRFEGTILLIIAAVTSDFSPVSPQSSNDSPLPLGIPSENHVPVDGHAKEGAIALHHRKHYHGRRYSVKAKVTESAGEGGNKKGNASDGASGGGGGGFGGGGGSGNGKEGGGSGNGGNRGLAQNNPPSNRHNNVANFDVLSKAESTEEIEEYGEKMEEDTEEMKEGTEGMEEGTEGVEEDTDGHMAKELVDAWRTQVSIARMNEGLQPVPYGPPSPSTSGKFSLPPSYAEGRHQFAASSQAFVPLLTPPISPDGAKFGGSNHDYRATQSTVDFSKAIEDLSRAIELDASGHKPFCLSEIGEVDISEDDDPALQDPFGHIKAHFPRGLGFRLLTRGEMDIVFARVACGDYILREG